jgi:hypothetical protein
MMKSRKAKSAPPSRSMQVGEFPLSTKGPEAEGSFKMHEISTQSIIQTSALFHQNAASLFPELRREEAVVSPELNSDDEEADSKSMDDDDSEKEDVELSMIHANHEPPPILIDNFVSMDCRVRVLSPLGEPKEVRFRDIPSDDEEDDGLRIQQGMEALNEQEKESFVLHEQLKNVLVDLNAEKAMRLRKDKSLIKLAKEIKKRNEETELHERKLVQMATLINNMQIELQQQQQRHVNQVTSLTNEKEKQILVLEETIETLRAELQAARSDIERLRNPAPEPVAHMEKEVTVSKSSSVDEHLFSEVVKAVCMVFSVFVPIVLLVLNMVDPSFVPGSIAEVRNVMCAPLRPGTKLLPHPKVEEMLYEGPWWVPLNTLKPMTHSIVCPGIPRPRVHWKGDKLVILDANDDTTLWQGRGPAGVQFESDKIHVLRTLRRGLEVPAPWHVRKSLN